MIDVLGTIQFGWEVAFWIVFFCLGFLLACMVIGGILAILKMVGNFVWKVLCSILKELGWYR